MNGELSFKIVSENLVVIQDSLTETKSNEFLLQVKPRLDTFATLLDIKQRFPSGYSSKDI